MKNLPKRIISGVLFFALLVLAIYVEPHAFPAMAAMVIIYSLREFFAMSISPDVRVWQAERFLGQLSAVCLFALSFCAIQGFIPARMMLLEVIPVTALMVAPIFRKDHSDMQNMAYIFAGIAYIAVPVCTWTFLMGRCEGKDGLLLLCVFSMIMVSDVGAYTLGTLLGQKPTSRKLAPSISSKKSWWGFAGSVIFGAGIAFAEKALGWIDFPIVHCIAIGIISSVAGVAGDLVESLWKRKFGVKDSGTAIPGHGGVYDRFDSSFTAVPLVVAYLIAFSLI